MFILRRSSAAMAAAAVLLVSLHGGMRAASEPAATGLETVFARGTLLQDRNGDGVTDFFAGSLVLGESPTPDDVAAAADIAARFGFETMALTLPLSRDAAGAVIAVGPAGIARASVTPASLPGTPLGSGQGLIALTRAGERPVVVVTGGDGAGVRAAATAFAARLPYVWALKGATLDTVSADARRVLADAGLTPSAVAVVGLRVNAGADAFERVIVRAELAAPRDIRRARDVLRRLRDRNAGQADAALSYPGAQAVEVQLASGTARAESVTLARVGTPPAADGPLARRPGSGAKEALDLSSLYTNDGLFGDSDNNLIPDRLDAIISPAAGAERVVDLAARLGLESTGLSFPVAVVPDALGKPDSQPTLVLVGREHPVVQELVKAGKLQLPAQAPGEGRIDIVRKAFGDKRAVVVTGGDAAGLRRALDQMAERFPHIWQRGKDRTTIDDVELDVRRFVAGYSPAGQAVAALYKLDQLAARLKGRAVETVRARVHVEKAESGLDAVVRQRLERAVAPARVEVAVENLDVQQATPIIDERIEIPSEVDEFWRRLRTDVIPNITRRQPVVVEARLSEPPEVRRRLERDATDELVKAGAQPDGTRVTVLSAYKQGFSWMNDVVRPALDGKAVGEITIKFAETGPPDEWKQQAMYTPTRWLLEIFPIDEVLARELGIDLSKIRLEKMPIGSPTYEVIATAPDGSELLRQTFEPKLVLRPYFSQFPDYEKVRVTTGWITARSGDRVLVDERIVTDLERFWDHFQDKTLARIYDYVMALEDGKPNADHAPFFGELTVDVSLSEPNYMLGIDKEQIASLDSLHEDIYFATLHFFDVLGRYARGRPLNYPGRVIPIMRPKADGAAGHASIRFTGFTSSHPAVSLEYVEKGGASGRFELPIPKVEVERPAAIGASVRDGRQGLEDLTLHLKVDTEQDEREALVVRTRAERVDRQIMSSAQVRAMLDHLQALRDAGLYREALAYHDLGRLHVTTHWSHEPAAATSASATLAANGRPAPFPEVTTFLPSGYKYDGGPIVQWDTPIPPPEANELLAKMSTSFAEATAYKVGQSYLGKPIWAMYLMPTIEASHWSMAKATALKPTVVYSARQHANEVSSTSHTLKLAELLLTDPAYRKTLDKVNVVFHPVTNPDGAQLAYDLYKITPDFMLHAGYLGSLGVDVTAGQWEQDPIYPESTIRADLWRDWRPDIFLNPHGYPSHEWVMLFSEYAGWVRNRVTESRDWWGMRGWFTPGFGFVDDPKFPRHKDAAFRIRDMFSKNMHAVPEIKAFNEQAYARYKRYGHAFDPENFKLDFTNDVLIYSAIKGSRQSASSSDFMTRNPNVTIWTGSTEAPDETAHGDWMRLVATMGLQWDKAILQYLAEGDHQIERKEDAFYGGVSLSLHRPRPPKPRDDTKAETSQDGSGARQE